MVSMDEITKYIHWPFELIYTGDYEDYINEFVFDLQGVMDNHNELHDDQIENFRFSCEDPGKKNNLDFDEYCLNIGEKTLLKGKLESDKDLYSLIPLITWFLETYHTDIIIQQDINEQLIEELNYQGRDEILCGYFKYNEDPRYFSYLKRLAEQFPHSSYGRMLKQEYRHRRNGKMVTKMIDKTKGYKRFF